MTHDEALATLASASSFPELLAAIHASRFTGKLTLRFYLGQPEAAELPPATPPTPTVVPLAKVKRAKRVLTPAPSVPHAIG